MTRLGLLAGAAVLAPVLLAGCTRPDTATGLAPGRVTVAGRGPLLPPANGDVGNPEELPAGTVARGEGVGVSGIAVAESGADLSGGDVKLDFSDTDIRDVVSQILGDALKVTYSIDPAVRGTATFHSAHAVPRTQLIPVLEMLLSENNATLVDNGGVYRISPESRASVPSFSSTDSGAGGGVIPLRYANAEELVKVLLPVLGAGARIAADPGRNAVIVTGEPQARAAVTTLVESFDTDALAGQSYALLPVPGGDAKDFASTLQDAFRAQSNGALAGLVRVLPMSRANAVLVVATNPRYLDDARRVYSLIARNAKETERTWHVYYLQNGSSNDIAYVLQTAFTPGDVTAQPDAAQQTGTSSTSAVSGIGGSGASGASSSSGFSGVGNGINGGMSGGASGVGSTGGFGGLTLNSGSTGSGTAGGATSPSSNPLVGSLEGGGAAGEDKNTMRIIPNPQNNALLIYATPTEYNTVEGMLHRIDLLPLQVRIDAVVAEVDLNDNLSFGTQFFFKEGSVNQTLSNGVSSSTTSTGSTTSSLLSPLSSGFQFAALARGVQTTLQALQAVTTVRVLSSPELMVLNNQPASLQVGSLVPYLQSSAQSTLTSSAPIVNSIAYQPTGVLLQVTPRVNSDGMVTMDLSQEVSSVANGTTTTGLNSPTFNDRVVKSRVVVADGQTLGIAGLISDNISKQNSGIPFLKDIPYLGTLFSSQTNQRQRNELIVLITPHVVHDGRDALALTEDLQEALPNAAAVPAIAQTLPASGASDPTANLRRALNLH